jgi:hypothetical protein
MQHLKWRCIPCIWHCHQVNYSLKMSKLLPIILSLFPSSLMKLSFAHAFPSLNPGAIFFKALQFLLHFASSSFYCSCCCFASLSGTSFS